MNVILVGFKAFVGLLSNSIAVILDAVNNLADVLSQVITIVGTKLSLKRPDKKHPYGYGRIEYLSSTIVAALVLVTGITSLKESIIKIITPEKSDYAVYSLVIIGAAVFVKFFFGKYAKSVGKKIDSDALIATGADCLMDSVLSLSTLAGALISKFFGFSLEGILGAIISCFIIKAGIEIIVETLSSIIGGRADSELSQTLKARIRQFDGVYGAYDLILHDYGPSRSIGSVHIEVPCDMKADKIHLLTRRISAAIYQEFGIILTVGLYATNADQKIVDMKNKITEIAKSHPFFLQLHGFFVDEEQKIILFDTVINYKAPDSIEVAREIQREVEKQFPDYTIRVNVDHDFSD